jgi:roadblock/LC7 domain-containing protein
MGSVTQLFDLGVKDVIDQLGDVDATAIIAVVRTPDGGFHYYHSEVAYDEALVAAELLRRLANQIMDNAQGD